jgi:uncharacterized membrane protein
MDLANAIPLSVVAIAVAAAGIVIDFTTVHDACVPLVCTSSSVLNCERVQSSFYSSVAGVPVSVGGIVWFAVTGGLVLMALVRASEPPLAVFGGGGS